MIIIKHKFRHFENKSDIQTLILGTFNPDIVKNNAVFFYGRGKNYLWNLLPKVFGNSELKQSNYNERISFIEKYKIGFVDLIEEISIEDDSDISYSDKELDRMCKKWTDFELFVVKYPNIKAVYFTRKSFQGIPNMEKQIEWIRKFCQYKNINFFMLPTPARFENQDKLNEWKEIFNL